MIFFFVLFILAFILGGIANSDYKKRSATLPIKPITEEQFRKLNMMERSAIFKAHHEGNNSGDVYRLFDFLVMCKKQRGEITYIKTVKEWEEDKTYYSLREEEKKKNQTPPCSELAF